MLCTARASSSDKEKHLAFRSSPIALRRRREYEVREKYGKKMKANEMKMALEDEQRNKALCVCAFQLRLSLRGVDGAEEAFTA